MEHAYFHSSRISVVTSYYILLLCTGLCTQPVVILLYRTVVIKFPPVTHYIEVGQGLEGLQNPKG
jgi:hypothetical protein